MDRGECATHKLDRVAGGVRVLTLRLLGQQSTSDSDQREAQLDQNRQWREGSGDGGVECLSQPRIMSRLLRTPGHDFDSRQPKGRASVNKEGGLALIGLDQGQFQLGPRDLEGQARETCA